jgi:hypothetical protein
VNSIKNEKYFLIDTEGRTARVQKQAKLLTARSLRSSCVDDTFDKTSDVTCSVNLSRLSSTMNPKTTSVDFIPVNDPKTDTGVTVLRSSQAEMPEEEINKRTRTTNLSQKIVPRRNSVVHVQRILTANKDDKIMKPISGTSTQPEADTSHPRVTRVTTVKVSKVKSSAVPDTRVINTTFKNNDISDASTIVKTGGNKQNKRRMKGTKLVRVVKLPRIKTSVCPNT